MHTNSEVREAAVAGLFYPDTATNLRDQIEWCFRHPLGPGRLPSSAQPQTPVFGALSPHAGYQYSGPIAAHTYLRLADYRPEVVVILGPNHHGVGAPIAVSDARAWRTPLGDVAVDRDISRQVASLCRWARLDNTAHAIEHAIEVQIPFIQYLYGESVKLVAIAMLNQDVDSGLALGGAIAESLEGKQAVVVASSDLNHYEPQATAVQMDRMALDAMLSMEPARLGRVVRENGLSVCGVGPIMAAMYACTKLGAGQASLLKHATSGDAAETITAWLGTLQLRSLKLRGPEAGQT